GLDPTKTPCCFSARKAVILLVFLWWAPGESNPAPTDYESAALTKHELEAHCAPGKAREVRNYCIKIGGLTSRSPEGGAIFCAKAGRRHETRSSITANTECQGWSHDAGGGPGGPHRLGHIPRRPGTCRATVPRCCRIRAARSRFSSRICTAQFWGAGRCFWR